MREEIPMRKYSFLIMILFMGAVYTLQGEATDESLDSPSAVSTDSSQGPHDSISSKINEASKEEDPMTDYYQMFTFETKSKNSYPLKVPKGLEGDVENLRNLIAQYDEEDIPYVLSENSYDYYESDKKKFALYIILSIWSGSNWGDFLSQLEDANPGIVKEVEDIHNSNSLAIAVEKLKNS